MTAQLSLSVIEIIVLMLGAITLGVTIHFFIASRRSMNASIQNLQGNKSSTELTEWKLKYFNDTEERDKQIEELKKKLADAEENAEIFSIEADEMRKQNKQLKTAAGEQEQQEAGKPRTDYTAQLKEAQKNLLEYNQKINELLTDIEVAKETEEKQQKLAEINNQLTEKVQVLQEKLYEKEEELAQVRRKEHITGEMSSILDSAYNEFSALKEKIQKLESQVTISGKAGLENEDLKEENYKLSRDLEEQRQKYIGAATENQELKEILSETEIKLREANFQRQQLQKKLAYLEELNNDMQAIADANKKLEGQMKRIGELESMLTIVSEERDELARRSG